jgi:hypothetical protein
VAGPQTSDSWDTETLWLKWSKAPIHSVPISSFNAQPRVSVDPAGVWDSRDIGEIEQISKKGRRPRPISRFPML